MATAAETGAVREALTAGAVGVVLLVAYAAIFLPLLPTAGGTMGHDYSYVLPSMLAGYFWYSVNGPWDVPWFTPAFCGGVPYLANIQVAYYALPQVLTAWMAPVAAIQTTMLVFAALGYAGFYGLLRRTFGLGPWPAVMGAGLFMVNGFFAYRMLIGHLGYHGFMLLPLAALLVLPAAAPPEDAPRRRHLAPLLGAGLVFAYMFQSGLFHMIPVVVLAIAGCAVVLALVRRWRASDWGAFALRFAGAGAVALALSAAKLAAAIAFHGHFPRDYYPLPGADSLADAARVAFLALFVGPPTDVINEVLRNARWMLERQELEYGVTAVPLVIVAVAFVLKVAAWIRERRRPALSPRHLGLAAVLVTVLAVPLVLNWYEPAWNAVLKRLPLTGQSSNLFRWFALYIPFAVLAAALALDRVAVLRRVGPWVAPAALALAVAQVALADKAFYAGQGYRPTGVENAYADVRGGRWTPRIDRIAVFVDGHGRPTQPLYRNDSLAAGGSQALCYEAAFGYRLETYPFGDLRPGPVTAARDGRLNIKNPACFVYPKENGCRPGDQYPVAEAGAAAAFAAYRPVPFAVPPAQRWAGRINLAALIGVPVLLGIAAWRWGRARRRPSA